MIHTDARFSSEVEEAVESLEARTDAEIVVIAAERSGSYRDLATSAAALASLVLLVAMLYVPYVVPPWTVPVELAVCFLLCTWLCNGRWFLRLVTPRRRLAAQVLASARAEFVAESVHGTPQRTGVLVYVSALEGRIEVIADVGLQGRIPPGEWIAATRAFQYDDLPHFLEGLRSLGALLARHVPPIDSPDKVALSDAPRIRP